MRDEKEIFADLSTLCRSPGYVHAIAYFCFRDNIVGYADELTVKDLTHFSSMKRLIRTEISTLIGLMIQGDICYALPAPDVIQAYLDRTEALLEEIHKALTGAFSSGLDPKKITEPDFNPFTRGDMLREPIFYGGESAYSFQYRDFSPKKYAADDEWLKSNKGFSIQEARDVVHAIEKLQEQKLMSTLRGLRSTPPTEWTILPGFTFNARDVAEVSGIDESTVEAVLNAFKLPPDEKNQSFRALHDFNVANATPLLQTDDGGFLLFQSYSLSEALYESPFYWMGGDEEYEATAMRNRGRFTEEFCRERLELVFGCDRVYSNVDIFETKGKKVGEIDVLVLFGDRAIVLQAKSKRLTLEARKGNDGQIRDDFKKSIQDSYAQGLLCAKQLGESKFKLVDSNTRMITISHKLKEIYILCVVSDHYPALSFQARQFLKYETNDSIQPPLVLDIFALDVMTEMLQSPLQFLSYVNRRVNYSDKLFASHENIILSYHLKQNLWLSDELDWLMLDDSLSVDLDVAMAVRREGVKGKETPDGILTRFMSTALGRIVKEIEAMPDPGTIDLGFLLLTLSEKTVLDVSKGIGKIAELARRDLKSHDLTIGLGPTGLTIHCNEEPIPIAGPRLQRHCELRKYALKARRWFGICLHPSNTSLRFGLCLDYEWEPNARMDLMTRELPSHGNLEDSLESIGKRRKIGRNDPCPCGSGLKYKKCCLRK